jgi:glutamate transport system substrate-binding protein
MTACAAKTTTSAPAGAADGDSFEKILAEAPVAAASDIPAGSAMAKIRDAGVLNVGGVETSTMFSLKDPTTGKVSGFDAYMSQLLAKYITGKPTTKITVVTSQTREQVLENRSVDVVFATYSITPARAERVGFAGPYYASPLGIGVAKTNASVKTTADLGGKDVCVQANSTAVAALAKAAPTAKPLLLNTNNECLEALKQGRVQAYVVDQALLIGVEAKSHDIQVLPFSGTSVMDPYGIGLPKDDPKMKEFVNAWLKTIMEKGLWSRVWKVTVGGVVQGQPPAPPQIGGVPGS